MYWVVSYKYISIHDSRTMKYDVNYDAFNIGKGMGSGQGPSSSQTLKPMKPAATKKPSGSNGQQSTTYSTTERPFQTSETYPMETVEPDNLPCNGMMFAEHPDCNKYYQCQHGMLHVMSCPAGLHWNKNHCDWPENSNCQSSTCEYLICRS